MRFLRRENASATCSATKEVGKERTDEAAIDNRVVESECLKDLSSLVRLQRRDAHLGHDLEDTAVGRVLVVLDDLVLGKVDLEKTLAAEL